MAANPFDTRSRSMTGPADKLVAVQPDDGVDLPDGLTRSLYVTGGGTLSVLDRFGNVATLLSGSGQYHPIRIVRVLATGTTASGILALY